MNSTVKFLYPGMQLKRWLVLFFFGIALMSVGVAYLLVQMYRVEPFPSFAYYVTLQFVDRPARAAAFLAAGAIGTVIALVQLNRAVLAPFLTVTRPNIFDVIHQHRVRGRGPKVVAIGGGTGLSTLLRGLKEYTANLTVIVTVADDGGSSGRLRRELGIIPPGDFRQCLVALADAEPAMKQLFQYRFTEGTGLKGHSFGNLFIAAMTATTGSFERALRESSRVLAVRGQIMPSTLDNLTLCAEFDDAATVLGESAIPQAHKRLRRVFLQPAHPPANPEAVRAILDADLIVVGPGSLFTSVLPNLLVDDITRALRRSAAVKVCVCNVATEHGETDGFAVADYLRAYESHVGEGLFQYVLVNNNLTATGLGGAHTPLVSLTTDLTLSGYSVVMADVIDPIDPYRHDSHKLARRLLRLYDGRRRVGQAKRQDSEEKEERVLAGA